MERGDRIYNGIPTELMNDLYDAIQERTDLIDYDEWPILSLYIARACQTLIKKGWIKKGQPF